MNSYSLWMRLKSENFKEKLWKSVRPHSGQEIFKRQRKFWHTGIILYSFLEINVFIVFYASKYR